MHEALPMKRDWGRRRGTISVAGAALSVFVIALAALGGAWYFQFVLGYPPCELCLQQRIPYYIVIPLSLVLAMAAPRAPRPLLAAGLVVILAAVLCGAALGAYHAGVEWHFWPGPSDCTGPLGDLTAGGSLLDQLQSPIHVVRCDQAAWRFLGISLAGYNVLISLAMAAIAGYGVAATCRRD